jgi:hypothetical protein
MSADFTSVRNHNERAVYDAVLREAPRYPGLAHNAELLFYLSERERGESERQMLESVEYAFGFVQARTAMRARG